jgi:hypothetical protein
MERDARCGGLERVRVDMAHHGDERILVGRVLDDVAPRLEEVVHTRHRCAWRKLRVEHLVDLLQTRVGSVGVALASRGREQRKKYNAS